MVGKELAYETAYLLYSVQKSHSAGGVEGRGGEVGRHGEENWQDKCRTHGSN